jgi:hypothetical protein
MKFKNTVRTQKSKLKIILNEGQVRRLTNKLIIDSQSKVKSR